MTKRRFLFIPAVTLAAVLYIAIVNDIADSAIASGIIQAIIPAAVPSAFKQGSTGTKFQIATGSAPSAGNCATWNATGDLIDSGIATCGGAGTAVNSFNGRTGAVTPQSGDYTAALVTNAFDVSGNQALGAHFMDLIDIATPTNPAATHTKVYTKNGVACSLSPAGVENCVGTVSGTVTSVDGSVALGVESIQGGIVAAITSSGSLRAAHLVNLQTGTTYTVLTGDRAKLVSHSNGSAIAVTLPQAGANFPTGWFYFEENRGAGTVTITPTTSTIDGSSNVTLITNQGMAIFSDGTNYFTMRGNAGGVSLSVANNWTATQTFSANNPITLRSIGIVGVNNNNLYMSGSGLRIFSWADNSACGSGNTGGVFGINLTGDCPTGILQVRGSTGITGQFGSALYGVVMDGSSGAQTNNSPGSTGAAGGAFTFTSGRGLGFNTGSGSIGGAGGAITLTAAQGGDGPTGSTNGNGGSITLTAGAPGGGAGTAGVDGLLKATGHWQTFNVSGSTSVSACGTSPSIVGTDTAGRIVEGSVATGCTISFARTWASAPACTVTDEVGLGLSYTVSTTAITITNIGALSSTGVHYLCMQ